MLGALERIAGAGARVLAVFGLALLMGLAAMTLADGLLRWLAARPIEGVRDVGALAVAVAIACCLPSVMIERGNIVVRLGAHLSARLGRVLDALAALVIAVTLAAIAWQVWLYAGKIAHARETTFVLQLPAAPAWYAVGVVLWFTVAVQVLVAARDCRRALAR